jgi:site-specific DNA recombinase
VLLPGVALRSPQARAGAALDLAEGGEECRVVQAGAAVRVLGAELDATVVGVFQDNDSGAEWDLPGLNALLDAARRRELDMLIVYDPDRLARSMAKQLILEEEFKRAGVVIRYVMLRLGDTSEDALLKNVRASIAEYEREKIKVRTTRGRRAKAEQGLIVGDGQAPYGYRFTHQMDPRTNKTRVVGIEPDPVTAPIVQRLLADAAEHSLYEITQWLNAEGIPTYRHGQVWAATTLRGILHNPAYIGEAAFGRRDGQHRRRDPASWITIPVPALVSRAEGETVQAALTRRKEYRRHRRGTPADGYLLRELLTCAHCGGSLACTKGHVRGREYRYCNCLRHKPSRAAECGRPVCSLPPVPADALEDTAWYLIAAALLVPEHLAAGMEASRAQHDLAEQQWAERRDTLGREIRQQRAKLTELIVDRALATRGSETWRALDDVIQATEVTIGRLVHEQNQLKPAELPGVSADAAAAISEFAAEIRAGISAVTPAERRRICQLLKLRASVQVDPEHGLYIGRHRFSIQWETVIDLGHNGRTFGSVFMDERFYDQYPDLALALYQAIVDATRLIAERPAAAAALLAAEQGDGGSPEQFTAWLTAEGVSYTTTPRGFLRYAEFMRAIGLLRKAPWSIRDLALPPLAGAGD